MIFRQAMLSTEESLAELTFEGQDLFFATLLTFQVVVQPASLKLTFHAGFN